MIGALCRAYIGCPYFHCFYISWRALSIADYLTLENSANMYKRTRHIGCVWLGGQARDEKPKDDRRGRRTDGHKLKAIAQREPTVSLDSHLPMVWVWTGWTGFGTTSIWWKLIFLTISLILSISQFHMFLENAIGSHTLWRRLAVSILTMRPFAGTWEGTPAGLEDLVLRDSTSSSL